MKPCRICQLCFPPESFVNNKAFRSGKDTICLSCSRKKVKEWRAKGKRDSAKEARNYYAKYPEKGRAKAAKRRCSLLNRTPPWVNTKEIEAFYLSCPKGFHVDHIVPLQGELVSGLHVLWNLQYLPASVNISKGNKW